ncbi:MAG: metalloregulator ArsR/SmtB family transcription factor [Clostridia bacterium]|nr:metalloregulator ArsR/SmtB family transcription factor [Clostridia bacterium]MDR3645719.1 metalloregulator ArsR/SmtB family transcription factor [Clostridia bacterium]
MTDLKIYEEKAELLKALAHPQRLCIVHGLLDRKCNVSKMQECLALPQSTVSQHLSRLRAAGIIRGERCGPEICYSVVSDEARRIVEIIFNDLPEKPLDKIPPR